MTYNIIISDQLDPVGWQALQAAPDVTVTGPFANRAELLAALPSADALIIRSTTQVDAELLQHASRLKIIARGGARLENVDVEAATRLGIYVCNTPESNVNAVAEYTIALLLQLARPTTLGHQQLMHGEWQRHKLLGFELAGKTLGIIGFGRIGQEVAQRAKAFGMHVLVFDPLVDLSFSRQVAVPVVPLSELLAKADIISLHAKYNARTHHLLGAAEFAKTKKGVRLVNCEHAELLDSQALLEALNSGQIAAAALDTILPEPPPSDHPLLCHPNVLVFPHLNQNTAEAQAHTAEQVVESVLAVLREQDYLRIVNAPFSPSASYHDNRPYLALAEKLGRLQGQLARQRRIHTVEIEVQGDGLREIIRPLAVAMLKGMLKPYNGRDVNYASAPLVAAEQGIRIRQSQGLQQVDYVNLISCRVHWDGGSEVLAGTLFAGSTPRLVQYGNQRVAARLRGWILFLENRDEPGVIGNVGGILANAGINIGEWFCGRDQANGRAISFINIDSPCTAETLTQIKACPSVMVVRALVA